MKAKFHQRQRGMDDFILGSCNREERPGFSKNSTPPKQRVAEFLSVWMS